MTRNGTTKLKLSIGALQLDYDGSEAFLRSELPKLVQTMDKLHASKLIAPINTLRKTVGDSLTAQESMVEAIKNTIVDLNSMSELGETESLRLQMYMDRLSKFASTLSNILKKISDTANLITTNLK